MQILTFRDNNGHEEEKHVDTPKKMLPNSLDEEVLNPTHNANAYTSPGWAIDSVNKEGNQIGREPEIKIVDKSIEEEDKSSSKKGSEKRGSKVLPSPPDSECSKKFLNFHR